MTRPTRARRTGNQPPAEERVDSWHTGCNGDVMEFIAVMIVLAVGVMLERGSRRPRPIRVRHRDR